MLCLVTAFALAFTVAFSPVSQSSTRARDAAAQTAFSAPETSASSLEPQLATPGPPSDLQHTQSTVAGNGVALLPEGDAGEIVVIAVGSYDPEHGLPYAIRNNMNNDQVVIEVQAMTLDAAGASISSGPRGFSLPWKLRAGDIAIGYVEFRDDDLPADAAFTFTIESKAAADARSGFLVDVDMLGATSDDGRIKGEAINTYSQVVSVPVFEAMCLDGEGRPLRVYMDFFDQSELAPGQTGTFEIVLEHDEPCPYLIASAGGLTP